MVEERQRMHRLSERNRHKSLNDALSYLASILPRSHCEGYKEPQYATLSRAVHYADFLTRTIEEINKDIKVDMVQTASAHDLAQMVYRPAERRLEVPLIPPTFDNEAELLKATRVIQSAVVNPDNLVLQQTYSGGKKQNYCRHGCTSNVRTDNCCADLSLIESTHCGYSEPSKSSMLKPDCIVFKLSEEFQQYMLSPVHDVADSIEPENSSSAFSNSFKRKTKFRSPSDKSLPCKARKCLFQEEPPSKLNSEAFFEEYLVCNEE